VRWIDFWVGNFSREEGGRLCEVREKVYQGVYSDSLTVVGQTPQGGIRYEIDPVWAACQRPGQDIQP
jgi:hypothetical protein